MLKTKVLNKGDPSLIFIHCVHAMDINKLDATKPGE